MNKTLPAGYQYFGFGPLPVLPELSGDEFGETIEVMRLEDDSKTWVRATGYGSSIEYALRIGSDLHKINFAVKLLNQIKNVNVHQDYAKIGFVCIGLGVQEGFKHAFNLSNSEVCLLGRHYFISVSKYRELNEIAGESIPDQITFESRKEYSDQEALAGLKEGATIYNSENKEVKTIAPNQKYYSEIEPAKEEIKIGDIVVFEKEEQASCLCLVSEYEDLGPLLIELSSGDSHPWPMDFIQRNYIKVSTLEKEFPKGFLKK
tara:strand:- start:6897 stop:7679 length:783 start_codon:yes stop_codon:yes gene_type:complete